MEALVEMINRVLKINDASEESVFLFGARQTGKTTLLLSLFPDSRFYDLLELDTYERLRRNPALLRQELASAKEGEIVIIDEIQLIPELPTTPFLLLSSWLFYRSSPRLQQWLLASLLGKYIRGYQRRGGMTAPQKAGAVGALTVVFFVPNAKNDDI